ncbi:MAG TPA: hypothetical protein VF085_08060 [Solirubrobacterales bacterium]
MPRLSATSSAKRIRLPALLLALLPVLFLLPDRAIGEDSPPVISNGILTPGILSYEGGSVSIGTDVVDDIGVAMVYAEVIGSDGTLYSVGMSPTGGSSYSAGIDIPPNFSEGEVSYSVWVWASDTSEAFSSELIGDIQVPAPPQFDEAPVVSDPSVQPRQLPAAGGTVTIKVTATDNRSVSEVYATTALPGGGSAQVPLEPISASRFEGVFTVPPNAGATAAQYGIGITALDDIGQPGSIDAGSVSVAARPVQPAGRLAVWPGSRSFGSVRVGRRAWRSVWVKNVGPRSTKPVEGVIQASGAPFTLLWGTPDGIHFRLRPGELRVYLVEFRPSVDGLQAGSVKVLHSDGTQPDLAVQLSGRGTLRR